MTKTTPSGANADTDVPARSCYRTGLLLVHCACLSHWPAPASERDALPQHMNGGFALLVRAADTQFQRIASGDAPGAIVDGDFAMIHHVAQVIRADALPGNILAG